MIESKKYFRDLDGIRTIAFLTVFISHIFLFNSTNLDGIRFTFLKNNIFRNGDLGVNLFFTLSGFLITYLLLREKNATSTINFRNFYFRRILRIWPLYFLTLLISISIIYFIPHVDQQVFQPFKNCDLSLHHVDYYFFFCANFALIHQENVMPFLVCSWRYPLEHDFVLCG